MRLDGFSAFTMERAIELLAAARHLIERPENWVQGAMEDYKDGERAWCALGAVDHVSPSTCESITRMIARDLLRRAIGGHTAMIGEYNDTHSHADVLAMFDRAIALGSPT